MVDELFPTEFWREVVDRMNREMPDTLLLAEALWLMKGYFVHILGMHRVYNSGCIMHSAPNLYNHKGVNKSITLSRALQLHPTEEYFYIVREHITGLEYLFKGADFDRKGFHWRLQGFEYRVVWQFGEGYDTLGEYHDLQQHLGGHGVPDMTQAL